MDSFKTHGAFSWLELMTGELDDAAAFYSEIFGWSVRRMDMPTGPYHVIKVGDTDVGGLMATPPDAGPVPPHWGVYITVDNVDSVAEKVKAHGGTIVVPPTDIPTVGRFAVLQDPQGAHFSVITYAAMDEG